MSISCVEKFANKDLESLKFQMDEIFAWAKIALTLLSSEPHSCQTFVAKYIAKIQEELPNISYNHIHGCKNLNVCGLAIRTTEL